jgi:hypothetical protein
MNNEIALVPESVGNVQFRVDGYECNARLHTDGSWQFDVFDGRESVGPPPGRDTVLDRLGRISAEIPDPVARLREAARTYGGEIMFWRPPADGLRPGEDAVRGGRSWNSYLAPT